MGVMVRPALIVPSLALAIMLGAPPSARAQLFPGLPFDSKQFTLEVVDENHIRFVNEVELTGEGWQFFADEIDFFPNDSRMEAVGNVVYVSGDTRLAADRAEVNIEDLTGIFYNAFGSVNMGSEEDIERSMFGTQEPDMYFSGETIEKIGPRTYRLAKGGFTSCIQPTPRWEMRSTSFTINLDSYILLKNMVLKVKSVPVFYMPALYYPVQDDDRATGFLMPTWGASTYRGTSFSNAFFLAMGRSHDATIFHDLFMQTGQGTGAEYRYNLGPGSDGNLRTYFLNEKETTFGQGGSERIFPERRSYEVRGNARHRLTSNLTARARVDFFSNVTVRQTYQQNVFQATNQNRNVSGNLSGTWGSYQLSGTFDATETFFGDTAATLWGGGPRVSFGQGQTAIPGTPFYYSFESEYVRLLQRDTRFGRDGGEDLVDDSGLHRFDVTPVLQIPFTKWPFLSVNTSLRFRSTYWTESRDLESVGRPQIDVGVGRNFAEIESELTGPTFVKIWDTPNAEYSERMKHVIEPWVSLRRVGAIDNFESIVRLEGIDSIVGNVTQVRYGLNNRLYGRGGSLGDAAREILTVSMAQSYYTDAQAAQYDRRFSTSFNNTAPSNLSPVSIMVRTEPSNNVAGSMRAEYDTRFKAIRTISAEGQYEHGGWVETTVGWSQRRFVEGLRGFDNPDRLDHYVNLSASMKNRDNTVGGAFRLNYDLLRNRPLQQRILVYYNAQCCGVSFEYQTFNFQGLGTRAPVPEDRRFNVSFTLAGLGTFANVLGAFGASGNVQ